MSNPKPTLPDAALDALAARVTQAQEQWRLGSRANHSERLALETCLIAEDVPVLIAVLRQSRAQVAELRAACEAAAEHLENERMVLGHGEEGPCNCRCCTYYEPLVRTALAATAAPPEPRP